MPEFHILDKQDFHNIHDQNKDGKLDLVSTYHNMMGGEGGVNPRRGPSTLEIKGVV